MRLARAALWLQFRFAPRRAEARAGTLFCTPRRSRSVRAPQLPGRLAERQVRKVGNADVVTWTWGKGPEVLLVHGWEGRSTQFEAIAERLVSEGFKVTAVDLPAHGQSSGRTTNLVEFANTVRAVAEERSGVYAVVAHSLGATAATLALLEARLAQTAVLLAPAAEPRLFIRQVAAFLRVPEQHLGGMSREVERRNGRTLDEVDLRRRAGMLELPMLVLHDEADCEVPLEHGEAVAKVSARGVLEPLRGLGHRRLLKDASVVDRIVGFLRPATEGLERKVQ